MSRCPRHLPLRGEVHVEIRSSARVQCTATTRALERQGISYEIVDISADAQAFDLVQGLGYRQVPVVVAGEKHWAGFRPDMISSLA